MILQKVEIKGFKSFANRTVIKFVDGITCVVGPNGCGKSNITDAIRWVLGEQSTKTLRAKKMQDVIFGGTQHRQKTNFAEVILYFLNDNNKETSLRRVLHSSGESSYSIDGVDCRLKDIKELIMDTGIGISGYSIIGQGNIEDILSDSKFDRRKIFEEASGISYLHIKKDEATKRLIKVDDNILRINDIYQDLSVRIKPLEKEAKKAEEYIEIRDKLKDVEIYHANNDCVKFEENLKKLGKQKNALEIEMYEKNSKRDEIIELKEEVDKKILGFSNESSALLELQRDKIETRDKLNIEINVDEEKIRQYKTNLDSINISLEQKDKEIKLVTKELDELNLYIEEIENKKSSIKDEISSKELEISKLKSSLELLGVSKEKLDEEIKDIVLKIENCKLKKDNTSMQFKLISDRLEEFNSLKKENQDEISDLENSINMNKKELEKYKENLVEISNIIENINKELKIKKEQRIEVDKFINESKSLLAKNTTEKNVISRHVLGNSRYEDIINYIKKSNYSSEYVGTVRELIKVPKKYEKAMEVALGSSVNNIVIKSADAVSEIIKHITKNKLGRATFIPLDFIQDFKINKSSGDGIISHAIDAIEFDDIYDKLFRFLFKNTLIAKDIDSAVTFSKKVSYRGVIVTLDGEIVQVKGKVTGGKTTKKRDNIFTLINRQKELDEEISLLTENIRKKENEFKIIELDIEKLKSDLSAKNDIYTMINDDLAIKEKDILENTLKYNLSNEKLSDLINTVKNIEEQKKYYNKEIEKIENEMNKFQLIFETMKEKSGIDKEGNDQKHLEVLNQEIVDLGIKSARLDEEIIFKKNEFIKLNENIKIQNDNKEKIKIDFTFIETELNNLVEKNDNNKEAFSKLLLDIRDLKSKLSGYEKNVENSREEIKKHDREFYEINNWINENSIILRDIEIEIAKNEDRKNNIINYIYEKYGLNFASLKIKKSNEYDNYTKKDMQSLKSSLKKLEPVNLNSPKEYKELKERYDFFTKQINDLNMSKKDIKSTIKSLEEKMKIDFIKTFNDIKENYSDIFSKLFRGGEANIYLEDEENVLDSDIVILASPPGKKLKHLSLLSGGEKALTAIALLFAVLRSKPAPFYILDEIEAALDDINIYRFGTFLEEFSKNSKFILITHRKPTMEFASALYGVSMEEKGISKMVSLEIK